MLSTPVALVSLIDDQNQFFKSQIGFPKGLAGRGQVPIAQSFCKNLLASTEPLALENTSQSPLVAGSSTLAALGAAAYLGVPLFNAAKDVLGVFCVVDSRPRQWTPDEIDVLRELAASVVTEIELRRSSNELKQSRAWLTALIDSTEDAVWAVDHSFRLTAANSRFRRLHHALFGLDVVVGDAIGDRIPRKGSGGLPGPLPAGAGRRALLGRAPAAGRVGAAGLHHLPQPDQRGRQDGRRHRLRPGHHRSGSLGGTAPAADGLRQAPSIGGDCLEPGGDQRRGAPDLPEPGLRAPPVGRSATSTRWRPTVRP